MGAGRFLRERKPSVKLVAVEPEESPVLSGGRPGYHQVSTRAKFGARSGTPWTLGATRPRHEKCALEHT